MGGSGIRRRTRPTRRRELSDLLRLGGSTPTRPLRAARTVTPGVTQETACDSFPGRLFVLCSLLCVSGQKNRVPTTQVVAAVRIRVSDQDLVEDLKTYLEAAECAVRVVGQVTLDVSIPRAPSDDQAVREIAIYLGRGRR